MGKITYNIDTLTTVSSSIKKKYDSTKNSCDTDITSIKKINDIKSGSAEGLVNDYNSFIEKWEDLSNKFEKYAEDINELEESIINGTYLPSEDPSTTEGGNTTTTTNTPTTTTTTTTTTTSTNWTYSPSGGGAPTESKFDEKEVNELLVLLKTSLTNSGYAENDQASSFLYNKFSTSILNENNELVYNTLKKMIEFIQKIPGIKVELDTDKELYYNAGTQGLHIGLSMIDQSSSDYNEEKFFTTLSSLIDQCVMYYNYTGSEVNS